MYFGLLQPTYSGQVVSASPSAIAQADASASQAHDVLFNSKQCATCANVVAVTVRWYHQLVRSSQARPAPAIVTPQHHEAGSNKTHGTELVLVDTPTLLNMHHMFIDDQPIPARPCQSRPLWSTSLNPASACVITLRYLTLRGWRRRILNVVMAGMHMHGAIYFKQTL